MLFDPDIYFIYIINIIIFNTNSEVPSPPRFRCIFLKNEVCRFYKLHTANVPGIQRNGGLLENQLWSDPNKGVHSSFSHGHPHSRLPEWPHPLGRGHMGLRRPAIHRKGVFTLST